MKSSFVKGEAQASPFELHRKIKYRFGAMYSFEKKILMDRVKVDDWRLDIGRNIRLHRRAKKNALSGRVIWLGEV